jgi:hypothetical protein
MRTISASTMCSTKRLMESLRRRAVILSHLPTGTLSRAEIVRLARAAMTAAPFNLLWRWSRHHWGNIIAVFCPTNNRLYLSDIFAMINDPDYACHLERYFERKAYKAMQFPVQNRSDIPRSNG